MDFEKITQICILIEMEDGYARQVLASKEEKQLMLRMLAGMHEKGLRVSQPIDPVKIIPQTD